MARVDDYYVTSHEDVDKLILEEIERLNEEDRLSKSVKKKERQQRLERD